MPGGEIVIPAPAPKNDPPTFHAMSILVPAIFALATLIPGVIFGNALSALVSLSFLIMMPLMEVLRYRDETRLYKQRMAERESNYRALLATRTRDLLELHTKQKIALQQTHPDIAECAERVRQRDRQLWARDPGHDDWLSVRMGLGALPFAVNLKPPEYEPLLGFDPLLESANELVKELSVLPSAPICLPLREVNAAGLVGPRGEAVNLARAMAMQLMTHHPPDEVKIVALYPACEARMWEWLRGLPHCWDDEHAQSYLASDAQTAANLVDSLYKLLNRRAMQALEDNSEKPPTPLPYFVVFLADPSLYENAPALYLMLTQGNKLGTTLVLLGEKLEALPRECSAIVECANNVGRFRRAGSAPAAHSIEFSPDPAPAQLAEDCARNIGPVQLKRTAAPIPRQVTLFELLGVGQAPSQPPPSERGRSDTSLPFLPVPTGRERSHLMRGEGQSGDFCKSLAVLERWRANDAKNSLAAAIGKRLGDEPLLLDLHETGDGPHGLLAGTTGAGKSELLQSLIASLAVNYHPHRVAFLLVDYKGGGMADVFADLPHLAGVVTDLEGTLANRALVAIRSELHRREEWLRALQVTHVDDYHALRKKDDDQHPPLPHLIIIVDEFAELVKQQPEFMSELISTARRGRSLGVHLLLATQQPAGVVNDQIWSNSRFRLCLRVERDEDSRDILKRPDAASLPKSQPGQAYLQVGTGEVFERFQAAWAGAPNGLGSGGSGKGGIGRQATQIQAIVQHLRRVADENAIPPVPKPWLNPLPDGVLLDDVCEAGGWDGKTWTRADSWMNPVIGRSDDPSGPTQAPLNVNLGRDGHLVIFGMPASGKTTLAQTLVTALARAHAPDELNMYLLDFGSRLLTNFAALPHVGAVIYGDENERVARAFRHLQQELERRKAMLAEAGVANLSDYRRMGKTDLPAIILVIDNYPAFATAYEDADELLVQFTREGGGYGLHVVLTVDAPNNIRMKLSSNIGLVISLQLKDNTEYMSVIGRTNGLVPSPLPGRGLVKAEPPLEFQTALPAEGQTEFQRTAQLKQIFGQMAAAWGNRARPRPINTLPEAQPLCELWAINKDTNSDAIPIGLDEDSLAPFGVSLNSGPHFMVAGPPQSGKTTLLRVWLMGLARALSPQQLHLILADFRQDSLGPLAALPHAHVADTPDAFAAQIEKLDGVLNERRRQLEAARQRGRDDRGRDDRGRDDRGRDDRGRDDRGRGDFDAQAFLAQFARIVLVIDDFDAVRDQAPTEAMMTLDGWAKASRGLGLHIVMAGAEGDFFGVDGWARTVKDQQTGFFLGSADMQVFNARVPYALTKKLYAPGQGFFVAKARLAQIKVATPDVGAVRLPQMLRQVCEQWPMRDMEVERLRG
jgi:S-DNA-T family DNA segregation ATPase FtsK/SpoIIIE